MAVALATLPSDTGYQLTLAASQGHRVQWDVRADDSHGLVYLLASAAPTTRMNLGGMVGRFRTRASASPGPFACPSTPAAPASSWHKGSPGGRYAIRAPAAGSRKRFLYIEVHPVRRVSGLFNGGSGVIGPVPSISLLARPPAQAPVSKRILRPAVHPRTPCA